MQQIIARYVAVAVLLLATSCGEDTPPPTGPSPVPAPTTVTPTPPPPRPDPRIRPEDPRFDLNLWEELVYAKHDRERAGRFTGPHGFGSSVLDHMRDFYLVTTDMPRALQDDIRAAIPQVWRNVTGEPFTGEIESGPEYRERGGLTTVFVDNTLEFCGHFADVRLTESYHPMQIVLDLEEPGCGRPEVIFRHELVHSLGFSHVSDPASIMHTVGGRNALSESEKYHTQLAYERGRGAFYCGWPFSAECFE